MVSATCPPDLHSLASFISLQITSIECTPRSAFLTVFLLGSLSDAKIFFFHFHMCRHTCARRDRTLGMILHLSSTQSNSELTDMASLVIQTALEVLFLPSETGITGGSPNSLAFRWVLGI